MSRAMSKLTDEQVLEKFNQIDSDHDGFISISDLEVCLYDLHLPISKRDLDEYAHIIKENDLKITSNQFLKFFRAREKHIMHVYNHLNAHVGSQDALELRNSLNSLGFKVSDGEIRDFVKYYDNHKNGKISYNEFICYLSSFPAINPRAAFDEFNLRYSALKYGETDVTTPAIASGNRDIMPPIIDDSSSVLLNDATTTLAVANQKEKLLNNAVIQLISGGIAGIVSRTTTAPIDRVKTLLQAGGPSAPPNFLVGIRMVYSQRGLISFFQGNGINCFKVAPETGLKMYTFELFKSLLAKDMGAITFHERFIAGGLAGATSQTIIYPLEIIKTRMVLSRPGLYKSAMHCMLQTIRYEGFTSLYKGLSLSIAGVIPYSGIDLMTNSMLRDCVSEYYEKRSQEPGVGSFLVCGMVSSTTAMSITYPIGLLRTRLQASGMPGSYRYKSVPDAIAQTYRHEGIRGFYKGFGPNLIKVVPASTLSYAVYGSMTQLLSNLHV